MKRPVRVPTRVEVIARRIHDEAVQMGLRVSADEAQRLARAAFDADDALDLDEAARRLSMSRRTLERRIAIGEVRVVHPSPGRTCVEEREVEAYLARIRRAA